MQPDTFVLLSSSSSSSLSLPLPLYYRACRQNNLHELWALLNFLLPDVFSSSEQFDEVRLHGMTFFLLFCRLAGLRVGASALERLLA